MHLAYEWLINGPAWVIGGLLAGILHLSFMFGPIWISIVVGGWVEQRAGTIAAWIVGIAMYLYISLVLLRSGTWMAVATLRALDELGIN